MQLTLENRNVLSNFFSLSFLQGANYILPLITLPYLVRVLGIDNFGTVMFAQAIIVYFNLLTEFGFNMSATREISICKKNKDKVSEIFIAVFIIKAVLLVISFLLLVGIITYFDKFNQHRDIYFYTFGMVIGQALFPTWLFQGMERMKYITILNILAKLIFTICVFYFIKIREDYYFVPVLNAVGFIISGILGLVLGIKFFKLTFVLPSKNKVICLFKDSAHLFFSNLSVSLYTATNIVILGFLTSTATVGIYSSIEKLVSAMKGLFVPLYQALFPWISQKPKEEIRVIIQNMIKYIAVVGLMMVAGVSLLSKKILELVFGNPELTNYHNILQIMSLISLLSGLNMLFNMVYLPALKAYIARMKIMLVAGVINISTVFVFTYKFGIEGTAYAVVMTEVLLLIMGYYYFRKISCVRHSQI